MAEITTEPAPEVPRPNVIEAAPRRGRIVQYGALIVLLAVATGGAIRLASSRGQAAAVSPPQADEIARAVARELNRRERGDTADRSPQHRTRSIPAYEMFLRGDDPALLRSDSAARRGREYFRRAVELDSTYAAAWAGLARMTLRSAGNSPAAIAQARVEAEAAARKALALDDSLAEAHAILGLYRSMDGDLSTAEQHFRRALALEPGKTRVREWFVGLLLMMGRPAEALAEAERAEALDPLSPSATAEVARALAANDRCDEALARLETIKALDPPLLRAAPIAAQCHARSGRWAEAIAALRPQAQRDSGLTLALLGYMYGRAGEREQALAIHARLRDRWQRGTSGALYVAFVPAALGDRDQAFTWLDRAAEDGSLQFYPHRVEMTGPPFDNLEQDPRMERLRSRFGFQKR
jgi:serine/threonine-protein kinase